jgi:glyoxylase-like metal-dependent hydrolase (beta-lactamase superfamily II)
MLLTSHSFAVGEFDCLAVTDGSALYNVRSFFCNAPDDELARALVPYADRVEGEKLRTPLNPLLIQADALTILIDTGLGPGAPMTAGKLLAHLAAEDITPSDIDLVILSHAHPDHIGGVIDRDGQPVFDQARYVLPEAEYAFWHSDEARARAGKMAVQIGELLDPIRTRLELVPAAGAILPGVRTIPAPGHTPGQVAVIVESAGKQLIYTADTFAHPLHFDHPTWNIIADLDRAQAVRSRHDLLGCAGAVFYIYHLPLPGLYP